MQQQQQLFLEKNGAFSTSLRIPIALLILCSLLSSPPPRLLYRRKEERILFLDKTQSCAPDLAYTHHQKNGKNGRRLFTSSPEILCLGFQVLPFASVLYTFAASLAKKEKKGRVNHFFHFFADAAFGLAQRAICRRHSLLLLSLCHHPDHHHLLPPPSIFFLSCYKVRGPPLPPPFPLSPPYNRFLERSIKEQGRCRCCLFFLLQGMPVLLDAFRKGEKRKKEDAESTFVGRNFPPLLDIRSNLPSLPPFPSPLLLYYS